MRSLPLVCGVFTLGIASLSFAGRADAAPTAKEKASARTLLNQARTAAQQKRWSDAAAAFRQADQLDPSPQTRLDLGRALVSGGKLVEAMKVLRTLASGPAATPGAKKIAEASKKLLAETESRVPWIQLAVTPKDATATLDGEALDASSEAPADPGEHRISVEAPGYETQTRTITLREGVRERVEVRLSRGGPVQAAAVADESGSSGGSKVPAIIAFSVGAVGIGLGATFGALAFKEASSAKDQCNGNVCPPSASDELAASKRNGTISTISFVAGGAAVATGVVLWIVSPGKKSDDAKKDARVEPWVGPGQAGLSGRF
jgi:hypothetical protein